MNYKLKTTTKFKKDYKRCSKRGCDMNILKCVIKKLLEGEMLEEMLFVKDGRICFEAAINLNDPSISIKKYFYEKFAEFNNIYESQLSENNKTGYASMMNSSISYNRVKTKITKALKV